MRNQIRPARQGALARSSQAALEGAAVHICGAGRIGTQVALGLNAVGVGSIAQNDYQRVEAEQLEPFAWLGVADVGQFKVEVIDRFLRAQPRRGVYQPMRLRTETPQVSTAMACADVIVSCANSLSSRLASERAGVFSGKPVVQAGVGDARHTPAGLVHVFRPRSRDGSCFACFWSRPRANVPRGEVLLTGHTSLVAALAVQIVQALLTEEAAVFQRGNLFLFDFRTLSLDVLAVARNPQCMVCGRRSPFGP